MLGFTRGFADGTRRQAMRLMARSIALAVVVSLFISGPLGTFAREQQPAEQPAQPPQPRQELPKREDYESSAPYIMGATIANFVFVPGKAVTCVLGLAVGSGLFLVTLGAGYKGSAAFAKEGCGGKWILTGRDLMGTDWILGTGDRADRN